VKLREVGEIWSLVGAVQESGKFQNWCTAWRRKAGRQATLVTVQRECLSWLSGCWGSVGAWCKKKWVQLVEVRSWWNEITYMEDRVCEDEYVRVTRDKCNWGFGMSHKTVWVQYWTLRGLVGRWYCNLSIVEISIKYSEMNLYI